MNLTEATDEQLTRARSDIGRPPPCVTSFAGVLEAGKRQRAWDAVNPEGAVLYHAINAELDRRERASELAKEQQYALKRFMSRIGTSGVGARDLDEARSPQETNAIKSCREWLGSNQTHARRKTWVILSGGHGVGKTVSAVWTLGAMAKETSVAFRSAGQVSRLSMFDAGAVELEELKAVGFLVLDDFGAEHLSKYSEGLLGDLMNARHSEYKPTLITTNLRKEDFKRLGGTRLSDRWAQDGIFYALTGVSLRRKEREPNNGK